MLDGHGKRTGAPTTNTLLYSTYADLAFQTWENGMHFYFKEATKPYDAANKYPNYWAWYQRLSNRPTVEKVYAELGYSVE